MRGFGEGQLRQWAVRGAEQRLLEIATEAAAIYRAFPELRDRSSVPSITDAPQQRQPAGTQRGRHMQKAAARNAARERMLRYWAARRKEMATQQGTRPTQRTGSKRASASAAGSRGRARTMSAAARKRISEAQKARWATRKAARSRSTQ